MITAGDHLLVILSDVRLTCAGPKASDIIKAAVSIKELVNVVIR
jgi:hypothetical protein